MVRTTLSKVRYRKRSMKRSSSRGLLNARTRKGERSYSCKSRTKTRSSRAARSNLYFCPRKREILEERTNSSWRTNRSTRKRSWRRTKTWSSRETQPTMLCNNLRLMRPQGELLKRRWPRGKASPPTKDYMNWTKKNYKNKPNLFSMGLMKTPPKVRPSFQSSQKSSLGLKENSLMLFSTLTLRGGGKSNSSLRKSTKRIDSRSRRKSSITTWVISTLWTKLRRS